MLKCFTTININCQLKVKTYTFYSYCGKIIFLSALVHWWTSPPYAHNQRKRRRRNFTIFLLSINVTHNVSIECYDHKRQFIIISIAAAVKMHAHKTTANGKQFNLLSNWWFFSLFRYRIDKAKKNQIKSVLKYFFDEFLCKNKIMCE